MKRMDEFRLQHISTNALRAGRNFELFNRFLAELGASGKSIAKIEFTCPEVKDLQTQLDSARESLAIALMALGDIRQCPHHASCSRLKALCNNPNSAVLCDCHVMDAENAIAEITKRGDYIPEGKG